MKRFKTKKFRWLFFLGSLLLISGCGETSNSLVEIGNQELAQILESTSDSFVYISIPTCPACEEFEPASVRKIIFVIGVLVIMLYSFLNISANLNITYDFMTSLILWGVSLIIFLTIFIIQHLVRERKKERKKKQQLLEQENERLSKERLVIEKQTAELKQVQEELGHDFSDMTIHHHAYKYVVPVLMKMQNKLIDEMNRFAEYSHDEKLRQLRDYTDQIRILTFEINEEFVTDPIKTEIAGLNIAERWVQLTVLLESLMQAAKDKGIYLSVYNHSTASSSLDVSSVVFIRLLSNIVDNAIKETCKLPIIERGEIRIIFKNDDEHFLFEVTDYAPEFEISILEKLGQRKNSINGTDDDYAEILHALDDVRATFIIKEWQNNGGKNGKAISVIFDGFSMRLIDSHYRYKNLMVALENTDFEVMDIY